MGSVIFDIETIGLPIEAFDEVQREYILKFADTDEKREAELQKLALSPLTAQVVAIAMINPETMGGRVFFQSPEADHFFSDDDKVEFISGTETDILRHFWSAIQKYDQFITFNGRGFDCPFLMIRSAMLDIRPTRNLVPYRYDSAVHCDLLEQLTFYGATKRFNLDFYCKSFGIRSPKSEGVSGLDVDPLFRAGRYADIARYCLGDVIATAELFRRWQNLLNIR
ncbi:MAG TPA: ribonuclease H-like domain-containing protein [Bacteroidota bacterium]|nr:ribonuclease H-like domain-containing protein [Bacteroidota bacterium]